MQSKLSVVIITFNRARKIRATLESISWADEILIIDGGSTDNTIGICRQYTDKIYKQPQDKLKQNTINIDLIKNDGFNMAACPWILSLDSDEIVSIALRQEIETTLDSPTGYAGFYIPRKNYYWGRYVRLLAPDCQLRLFKKGKGKYVNALLHQQLLLDGKAGQLKGHLIHNNYESIMDFIKRAILYSRSEAQLLRQQGEGKRIYKFFGYPLAHFIYYYFRQQAYRDGLMGLTVCILYSLYHFISYVRFYMEE